MTAALVWDDRQSMMEEDPRQGVLAALASPGNTAGGWLLVVCRSVSGSAAADSCGWVRLVVWLGWWGGSLGGWWVGVSARGRVGSGLSVRFVEVSVQSSSVGGLLVRWWRL